MGHIAPTSKHGMHRYICDHVPTGEYTGNGFCREEFRTASIERVHAKQLIAAGWSLVVNYRDKHATPRVVESLGNGSGAPRAILCPAHHIITPASMFGLARKT